MIEGELFLLGGFCKPRPTAGGQSKEQLLCWPRENIGSVGGEGKTIGQKRPHIVCNEGTKCLQLDLYVFIGVALKVLPFFLFVCHVCWLVVTFLDY